MHPVQKHLFDTNFRDLAGTRIEGTIALSEELINLGVMDFLGGLKTSPQSPPETTEPTVTSAAPNPQELLKIVSIDTLKIRMEKGKLLVDVKAGI